MRSTRFPVVSCAAILLTGSFAFVGCDDTSAEREQKIENAADATGDALRKGAEKTGEVLDKAAQGTGDVVNKVNDKVSRTDVDVDVDVTTRPATTRAAD